MPDSRRRQQRICVQRHQKRTRNLHFGDSVCVCARARVCVRVTAGSMTTGVYKRNYSGTQKQGEAARWLLTLLRDHSGQWTFALTAHDRLPIGERGLADPKRYPSGLTQGIITAAGAAA